MEICILFIFINQKHINQKDIFINQKHRIFIFVISYFFIGTRSREREAGALQLPACFTLTTFKSIKITKHSSFTPKYTIMVLETTVYPVQNLLA
jgi:hypothetical protein